MDFYYARRLGIRRRIPAVPRPDDERRRVTHDEVWREGVEVAWTECEEFSEDRVIEEIRRSPSNRFTLILGEPGAGKGYLAGQWFRRMAAEAIRQPLLGMVVPVRVVLRSRQGVFDGRHGEELEDDGEELEDALWRACAPEWTAVDAASDQERHTVKEIFSRLSGRLFEPLWLFDGLDELPPSVSCSEEFYQRLVALPGRKMITCRTAMYPSLREVAERYKHREYEVMGLKPTEQREFLRQAITGFTSPGEGATSRADRLSDRIQRSTAVRLLAGNALMLTLIAEAASGPEQIELPESRTEFYRQAIDRLWYRKLKADPEALRLKEERDEFLVRKVKQMGLASLGGKFDACGALERGLRVSGLVRVNDEQGNFEFLHLTFQEYHLAKALSQRNLREVFEEHWSEPRYEETLGLLVSLLFKEGRSVEIEAAIPRLIKWARSQHKRAPQTLWAIGSSPLRAVFHVLERSAVPVNSSSPLSGLYSFLKATLEPSASRRMAVASDRSAPLFALQWLATDEDSSVRGGVAMNANTPAELLTRLAADQDSGVRRGVAENVNTPAELLARLAADEDSGVRSGVAGNVNTPAELLARLAADQESWVRSGVARNANIPVELLARLAADREEDVRFAVARNANTPAELLARLAADQDDNIRTEAGRKVNIPVELLARCAADQDSGVRLGVAGNVNTPAELLARLAADEDRDVRRVVSLNANTPVELLARLAADRNVDVRLQVAWNANTPADLLARLAADEDRDVRGEVARNANTPVELLPRLAADRNGYVRSQVTWNANTPPELLARLAADQDSGVRSGVAGNVNTPAELLARLAADEDSDVRSRVARNARTLLEDL